MKPVTNEEILWFQDHFDLLVQSVGSVILGKSTQIELALTAIIARGHLLLEDYPGTGKTALARALAGSIDGVSTRIQFTPDLLPGDITGITVFDQRDGSFHFHAGPVFSNIVLADEINRASPKTQSALLEVMAERRVTVDGRSRPVRDPFAVIATQNPIEQAGTYRLPEAQLDRFLIKTSLGYPDMASTVRILGRQVSGLERLECVADTGQILAMCEVAERVYVAPSIVNYISRLVQATRVAAQVRLGASVRGALSLRDASKVRAAAKGRTFVTPDDVKALTEVVLAHRMVLHPEFEFEGLSAARVVQQILLDVEPPKDAGSGA